MGALKQNISFAIRTLVKNKGFIRMNGEQYTVVGVLPPGMHDRFSSQLWAPRSFRPEEITHDTNFMPVMARLKDGVTIDQAQAEMNGIAAQLQQESPKTNANRGVSVECVHWCFGVVAGRSAAGVLVPGLARQPRRATRGTQV